MYTHVLQEISPEQVPLSNSYPGSHVQFGEPVLFIAVGVQPVHCLFKKLRKKEYNICYKNTYKLVSSEFWRGIHMFMLHKDRKTYDNFYHSYFHSDFRG